MPRRGTTRIRSIVAGMLFCIGAVGAAGGPVCMLDVHLRDRDDGDPRVDVRVRYLAGDGVEYEATATAEDPRATFENVDCAPGALMMSIPVMSTYAIDDRAVPLDRLPVRFGDRRFLRLEVPILPIRKARVRVVDPEGSPVRSVVEVTSRDHSLPRSLSMARVDENGNAELWLPKGRYTAFCSACSSFDTLQVDGVAIDLDSFEVSHDSHELLWVTKRRPTASRSRGIELRVTDHDGVGVEGVEVRAIDLHAVCFSGADGTCMLDVPDSTERLRLAAYDPLGRWRFDLMDVVLADTEPPLRWVALPWETPRLTIRVVADDTGRPVVGASVNATVDCLAQEPSAGHLSVTTDQAGTVSIPCSRECPVAITVYTSSSDSPEYEEIYDVDRSGSECGGESVFRLGRNVGLVGRVVDEAGHPLEGLRLELSHLDGEFAASETTDEDGRFQLFGDGPGSYYVDPRPSTGLSNQRLLYLESAESPGLPLRTVDISAESTDPVEFVAKIGGALCVAGARVPGIDEPYPVDWIHLVPADATGPDEGRTTEAGYPPPGGCVGGLPPGRWRFLAVGGSFEGNPWSIPAMDSFADPDDLPTYEVVAGRETHVAPLPRMTPAHVALDLEDHDLELGERIVLRWAAADPSTTDVDSWTPVPPENYRVYSTEPGIRVLAQLPEGTYRLRLEVGDASRSTKVWQSREATSFPANRRTEVTLGPIDD